MADVNKIVKAFVKIRDARAAAKKVFEDQDNLMKNKLEVLEGELLKIMTAQDVKSFRTDNGTVYVEETVKPSVNDWDLVYKYIKKTDNFDALEKRVKSTWVKEYMEEHGGDVPPGVSVHRELVARVRRK